MPRVRAREGEGCSNSSSEDEPLVFKRTRTVPPTFHYRNPTSIIIQSTIETRGEEDAQSEEANGEQDHHHGEQEVEEGQQREENDEDQEDFSILNVKAEGEQDHLISDLEAEEGQQSEEYQEDDDDLNVEVEGEQDYHQSEEEMEEGQQSEGDQEDDDELNVRVEGEQEYHQSEEELEEGQQSEEHEVDEEDVDDSNVEAQGEQDHHQSEQEVEEGQRRRRRLLLLGDQEGRSSTSATREGSNIVITLTDPGLLDCPICFEPLTIPVFQCDQNGHIACSSCCTKINNKCPFCSCPIGSNRCRAIENVVESSTTPCQNSKYGCTIPVAYNKKYEHENACVCSSCSCPRVGCKFVSSIKELYQHFHNEHCFSAMSILFDIPRGHFHYQITLKKSENFLVVRERCSGTLFILHNRIEVLGNVVSVSCIQPSFMEDFNYQLIVRNYESTLKFLSVTRNTPILQVDGPSPTSYLLIPCEFFNSRGKVKIDVSIWHK